jgi:hypothetical protein
MFTSGLALRPAARRLRFSVHLATLLMLFVSIAQAMHHHGSQTGGTIAHASKHDRDSISNLSNDSELTCPLCIVGHSTLPAIRTLTERPGSRGEPLIPGFQIAEPHGFWSYNLFCRPPPSANPFLV